MGNAVRPFRPAAALAAGAVVVALAGCAQGVPPAPGGTGAGPSDAAPASLTLVTHDSFALSDGILEQFTAETGIAVEVVALGDAGELVNKLVLTKDSPLGDVAFGIDNTFSSRVDGIVNDLTAIDSGDVCVNVDHEAYAAAGMEEPRTLADLIEPAYKDQLVVEGAGTSSPGLAFLLATIDEYGEDGWQDYWRALVANGVQVDAGWTDAYYATFSGPSSEGTRPLVVSYATSPAAEVVDASAEPPTGYLEDTCFRQTEYAGVVAGTEHEAEAAQLVEFLLSPAVQADIPGSMYMYPIVEGTPLPETWAAAQAAPAAPRELDPAEIDANRERWIEEWAAIAQP
ncbi:MAG: thiamine ABC transporter substrate-binding protein [Microbacteriaceae bacterium]|nr:thiamine ABC transporter substrate-binding protein [Microbacteriaceae bacterium]